jgi:hypothetical protein
MHTSSIPEKRAAFFPLIGASLLSAVGSMPMHLAPFVTVAMIVDARTSVAGAGWVWSVAQLGEITTALLLPLLGLQGISRKAALLTAVALMIGLMVAAARVQIALFLGWFLIGGCCGLFKYLGVVAASRASRLSFAFSLRLSVVLMLAGSMSAVLATFGAGASYQVVLFQMGAAFAAVLLIGLVLHRSVPDELLTARKGDSKAGTSIPYAQAITGMVVVYFFFVGLSGVLVYVLHQAVQRGMVFEEAALGLAATKVSVGLWLLLSGIYDLRNGRHDRFVFQSAILVLSTIAIHYSRDRLELFAALLCWELAVNGLSAKLQAAVVRAAPHFAGRWLNVSILLGAATGPVINGYVTAIGWDALYVILGAITAFAPAVWSTFASRVLPTRS